MQASTFEPDPRSLKIPAEMAKMTRSRASCLCKGLSMGDDGVMETAHLHVSSPFAFKDGHGGETARAHGDVGKFVGRAVGVNRKELGPGGIYAAEDQCGADMALVSERQ